MPNNRRFFKNFDDDRKAVYQDLAERLLQHPIGETFTNGRLLEMVGYNPDASPADFRYGSTMIAQLKKGVDNYYASEGHVIGFAMQRNEDKERGQQHLLQGRELVNDRDLNDIARIFSTVCSAASSLDTRFQAFQSLLTQEDKVVFNLIFDMANGTVDTVKTIANDDGLATIEATPGMQPLADLIHMARKLVLEQYPDEPTRQL